MIQGLAALATILSAIGNYQSSQENLAYQRQLNQQQFQREDTAVQRRYADLRRAGINPLLAAGGQAAMSSPVRTGEAPQFKADWMEQNLRHMTIRRLKQQLKNDKAVEKHIAAQTQKTKEDAANARYQGMLLNKDNNTYNERLWHQRLYLGGKLTSDLVKPFIPQRYINKGFDRFTHKVDLKSGEVKRR